MKTSLVIADDFLPGPEMIRRRALLSDFQEREYGTGKFKGVGLTNQPHDMEERIGRLLCAQVKLGGSFYRTGMIGCPPTTYIHADSNHAEYAGVLYLNTPEQCRGGTAFWKNKELGIDELPMGKELVWHKTIERAGQDESNWEMVGLATMKFNRFIVYPTKLFHSQYPQEPWGDSIETGRLIWATFFNLV